METIQCQINDRIATVTMYRPTVYNAMNAQMVRELHDIFIQLGLNDAVRVIILTGAGNAFSAGVDLNTMKTAATAPFADNKLDAIHFSTMLKTIYDCPKVVIAKVNGLALGGGVGLTASCDIAIADENAQFCTSEAKFGIIPSMIAPYLIGAVGKRAARYLALSATRIDAEHALRIGLIHFMGKTDELEMILTNIINDILIAAPNAQREIKQLYDILPAGQIHNDIIDMTASTIARIRATPEAIEGINAFLEKRRPSWTKPQN